MGILHKNFSKVAKAFLLNYIIVSKLRLLHYWIFSYTIIKQNFLGSIEIKLLAIVIPVIVILLDSPSIKDTPFLPYHVIKYDYWELYCIFFFFKIRIGKTHEFKYFNKWKSKLSWPRKVVTWLWKNYFHLTDELFYWQTYTYWGAVNKL